jgi:uncharacterized SAM-binding protein YcdF (DUF218 family)
MELAQPKPGEVWVLVTRAMHMPRAVASFSAEGFDVLPFPVDPMASRTPSIDLEVDLATNLVAIDTAAYEWAGLLAYQLAGFTAPPPPKR